MVEESRRIQRPSELDSLVGWRLFPPRSPKKVRLEAIETSPERVERWEHQLHRLQSACGCDEGAVGLLIGIAGYLLYLLVRPGGWGEPDRMEFWVGFGVVTMTTSMGKAFGLARANQQMKRLIREIRAVWSPIRDNPDDQPITRRQKRPRVWPTRCCGEPNPAPYRLTNPSSGKRRML